MNIHAYGVVYRRILCPVIARTPLVYSLGKIRRLIAACERQKQLFPLVNSPFAAALINKIKGNTMPNENKADAPQLVAPLKLETYQRLMRAQNVTQHIGLHLRTMDANIQPLMWLPDVFSYVSEDLNHVTQDLDQQGLLVPFQSKPTE